MRRLSRARTPNPGRRPVSATHVSAALALAFAARSATFAASWFEIPLLAAPPARPLPRLSIVVPARNEARSIERCVRSLLAQRFVDAEVIVVDDRSEDATLAILERLQRDDPRLQIVRGEPLPDGWVGKPWALHQGARRARGPWLLFTDADSEHAPAGAASALAFAVAARVDALSIVTAQELGTFWERATLPFILGMIFYTAGTLAELNDPLRADRALANGQYVMVAQSVYDALGGHVALRGEIVEDVRFAIRLKEDGRFRLLVGGGTHLARVRMYHSLGEIWNGFTKNLFVGAEGSVPAMALGVVTMLTLSAPPVLALRAALRARPYECAEALVAWGALATTSRRGIRMVGMPGSTALLQPLGTAVFAAILAHSAWCGLSGRGVEWRGRRYSGRPARARRRSR